MPRYSLNVQITAQRLPDPPPPAPAYDPGKDPLHEVAQVMRHTLQNAPVFHPQYEKQSGAGMSRTVEVTLESFAALAEILGKFDQLSEQIECDHPIVETRW